jgi:hypothetical protein
MSSARLRLRLDQTGRRAEAAQGSRTITSRSGVPAARGGLQPDPPGQPAQPAAGAGMTGAMRGGQRRFSIGPRGAHAGQQGSGSRESDPA